MTTAVDSARNIGWVESLDGVPVDQIGPNPANPRRHFDEAALAELVESIRQFGVLEPLLVRRRADRSNTKPQFVLIAGERRWRAAQVAGVDVPVRVLDVDDTTALRIALVENLVRRDLDPIEEAAGYARLNREGGMRQAEIAAAVNRSQPAVANAMRLLELPEDVQERIRRAELSVSHGIALCRYAAFPALVTKLADEAVEGRLTSKALEDKGLLIHGQISWQLAQANLTAVVYPDSTNTPYMAACRECPLGARRADDYGRSVCLRPDHLAELRAAWEAERAATLTSTIQAQRDQAAATGDDAPALPLLSEMDFGAYKRFYGPRPEGCSEQCACSLRVLNHAGEVELVCADPKRAEKLETAATKARNRDKRLVVKAQLDRVTAAIDELYLIDTRSLALVVAGVFHGIYKSEAITACLKRHAPELAENTVSDMRQDLHEKLAELDVLTLLRIGVEAVLRNELREAENYGTTGKRAEWWLAGSDSSAELLAVAERMKGAEA